MRSPRSAPSAVQAPLTSAFDSLDEAFFSSEVEPIDETATVAEGWPARLHASLCEWVIRLRVGGSLQHLG